MCTQLVHHLLAELQPPVQAFLQWQHTTQAPAGRNTAEQAEAEAKAEAAFAAEAAEAAREQVRALFFM